MVLALAGAVAAADEAFTFVNDGDYGYSYIQINQDLDSFKFKSDWHSLGNAGKVGYVVYPSDLSKEEFASYMESNANNPQFRKSVNGGVVDLPEFDTLIFKNVLLAQWRRGFGAHRPHNF